MIAQTSSTLRESNVVVCPHCGEEFLQPCKVVRVGRATIDGYKRRLVVDDEERKLEPRPFELLSYMARHPGRAFSRDQLMDGMAMWDHGPRALEQHIHKIRRAAGDALEVRSHWGFGWSLHERTTERTAIEAVVIQMELALRELKLFTKNRGSS